MNMKKRVFDYMNQYPKATTADLLAVFPTANKKSLWNYSREWKKNRGIQAGSGSRDSVRQRVFAYINQHPEATPKDLQAAFPDANKISISNYHYQWRKSQPQRQRKRSVKSIVFAYLDEHPNATFKALKEALPDINPSSISAYQSIWKRTAGKEKRTAVETHPVKTNPASKAGTAERIGTADHQPSTKELIETLKTTIRTQEIAIEVMKEQNALLRQSQPEMLTDLEGVSGEAWQHLRNIITVFIKGFKD